MKIYTQDLYKGAFYKSWGCELVEATGQYPQTTFLFEVSLWLRLLEKLGWVNYRKFKNSRVSLKKKSLNRSGFTFAELAHTERG